jgi:hypothetical protein
MIQINDRTNIVIPLGFALTLATTIISVLLYLGIMPTANAKEYITRSEFETVVTAQDKQLDRVEKKIDDIYNVLIK